MQEPNNQFMYAEKMTPGDKFVLIGDAIRNGANGYAMYYEGHDFDKGKDFARVAWRKDVGDLPFDWHVKIWEVYETQKVTAYAMQLDVAIEKLIDAIV